MYNILTDSLIRFDKTGGSRVSASLPEVYAALVADEVNAFPALRPHQRHAWHAFLVQLGAMAMHSAKESEPPSDAAEWAGMIRGLTPDYPEDEPWQLVVDDITKPAFMQPPASSREREKEYKTTVATPDELDMLVTSKNHDIKSAVAAQSNVDDWIFALITLQTMGGYSGPHNYGVSRMPSGYGNRPAFSLTPFSRPGTHIRHDLIVLLKHRRAILSEYQVADSGIALLWLIPWNGAKTDAKLLLTDMEPYYIEICRRVRLRQQPGKVVAIRAGSDARRIIDAKGLTGDPWAPVGNNTNPKGTPPDFLGRRKLFGYERVVDGLLSADWKQPLLLNPASYGQNSSRDMQLVARGMVRGQGETSGYHERVIPLRHRTMQVFGRPGGPKALGDIAKSRIEEVGKLQRILRHAIATFVTHDQEKKTNEIMRARAKDNPLRKKVDEWVNKLDEIVDASFFEDLQTEFEADGSDERQRIRNSWLMNGADGVVDHARNILSDAVDSLPCPAIYRYKARVRADSVFWRRLRGANGLPFLFQRFAEEDSE